MRRISFMIMFTVLLLVCVQISGSHPASTAYVKGIKEKVRFPIYDAIVDLYGEDGNLTSGPDWQDITETDVVRHDSRGPCVISLTVNSEFPSMDTFRDGAIIILVDIDGDGEVVPSEGAIDFYEGNLDYGIFIPSPEFGEPPIFIQDLQQGPSGPYDTMGATYSIEGNRIEIEVELSHIGTPEGVLGLVAAIRTGITTDLVEDRVPNEGLGYTKPGYELFGPRADRIIIKTYENAAEMLSALEKGELDIAYDADNESVEYNQHYTGGTNGIPITPDDGENKYRGKSWVDINFLGYPSEGNTPYFDSIGMHPMDYELGDGENMTIRYGCTVPDIPDDVRLNVIYGLPAEEELGAITCIFESLVKRDPCTLHPMPWLAEDYTMDTWLNPDTGENCSKVKFTLRPHVTWHDGTPLTAADVYFTLIELPGLLEEFGYPSPAWIDNVTNITDFKMLDPYNFEVLFSIDYVIVVGSMAAAMDVVSNVCILPMHIWKPIVEEGDPTAFAPDPNMIGSGPWRFASYDSLDQLTTLEANRPGSTVQTNLPGSSPTTSPTGYFSWITPPDVPIAGDLNKIVEFKIESEDADLSDFIACDFWRWVWGRYYEHTIIEWVDEDDDGFLGPGDKVRVLPPWGEPEWYTVLAARKYLKGAVLTLKTDPRTLPVIFAAVTNNLWLDGSITIDEYVYTDETLLSGYPKSLTISQGVLHTEVLNMSLSIGVHRIKVATYITSPDPWAGRWQNVTKTLWVTIAEDIAGSTFYDDIELPDYPFKGYLPTPDFKVNIIDIASAAKAFGTVPGHPRWDSIADVNIDYEVSILDIASIAKQYGWSA